MLYVSLFPGVVPCLPCPDLRRADEQLLCNDGNHDLLTVMDVWEQGEPLLLVLSLRLIILHHHFAVL